jgi:hypothetical protein
VGADDIGAVARDAGFGGVETWTVDGRWFAEVRPAAVAPDEPW